MPKKRNPKFDKEKMRKTPFIEIEKAKPILRHTLRKEAFLNVNKVLAKQVGLNAAVLLADLISKEQYFEERNQLKEENWFFNTQDNIQKDTTLSPYYQRKALKKLKEEDFVEVKKMGVPAKNHFKLFHFEILKALITSGGKFEALDVKNVKHSLNNNKDNNNMSASQNSSSKNEKKENQQSEIKELIDFYYSLCRKRKNITVEITAADGARIKKLLNRAKNPLSVEDIYRRMRWYIKTDRFEQYPSIKAALSAHSLNKYDLDDNKRDPDLYVSQE